MSSFHVAPMSRQGPAYAPGTASRPPYVPPSVDGNWVADVRGPSFQRTQRLCRFYMSGFCASGDGCRFLHPRPPIKPPAASEAPSRHHGPSFRIERSSHGSPTDSWTRVASFDRGPREEYEWNTRDLSYPSYNSVCYPPAEQRGYEYSTPAPYIPRTPPRTTQPPLLISSVNSSPLVWPPPRYKLLGLPRPTHAASNPRTAERPSDSRAHGQRAWGYSARRLTFESPNATSLDASAAEFIMPPSPMHSRNSSMEVNVSSEALVSPPRDTHRVVGSGRPTPFEFDPPQTSSPPPRHAALRVLDPSAIPARQPSTLQSSNPQPGGLLEGLSLDTEGPSLSCLDSSDHFPVSPAPSQLIGFQVEREVPLQLQPSPDILPSSFEALGNHSTAYETRWPYASGAVLSDADIASRSSMKSVPPHTNRRDAPSAVPLARSSSDSAVQPRSHEDLVGKDPGFDEYLVNVDRCTFLSAVTQA
ncbi:hypothetical protein OE88DRAFT_1410153 [Heliocybe sulcata]|uniref:C3H1-type domain-containing protein n=1 Tax=Heliocybe sulcata TaxID=5364 RepID=A0A5C3N6Q9_9AGAM|nr:hypothetical protein OE88DRAFT_1410153 [Heliocybe sulcata]